MMQGYSSWGARARAAQKHAVLQGQVGSKPLPICQHLNPHACPSNSLRSARLPLGNSPRPARLPIGNGPQPATLTLKWSISGWQASMSFPLLSYTTSNQPEGMAAGSAGLPHTTFSPGRLLYWLKGALPDSLACAGGAVGRGWVAQSAAGVR